MEIWLILDGEKTGPLHDYEVRRRIEAGDLSATTPAWHEGMAEWQPLCEIHLFANEFKTPPAAGEIAADGDLPVKPPPAPMPPPCYGRRFWARWFDFAIYAALWWFGMWLARQNIEAAMVNPWIMFLQFVPWFAIEALLLHYTATTPGKWLLGLRVVNHDASKLDLTAATRRSMRVLFTGVGFVWIPLALICQGLSLYIARRLGSTLWDHTGGHRVTVAPLSVAKMVVFFIAFIGALSLQMAVFAPYVQPSPLMHSAAERWPQLKEEMNRKPQWQLPRRDR